MNDYNALGGSGIASDFDGEEGTFAAWLKVYNASVWTDANYRQIIRFRVDANNEVNMAKGAASNKLAIQYNAGGTNKTATPDCSATTWTHFALTWSKAADQVKVYIDGSQSGATITGLGAWAGTPTTTIIGAANATPTSVWNGYLAHAAVWTTPLSAAEILALATV